MPEKLKDEQICKIGKMYYADKKNLMEIAEELGISVATVHKYTSLNPTEYPSVEKIMTRPDVKLTPHPEARAHSLSETLRLLIEQIDGMKRTVDLIELRVQLLELRINMQRR